MAEASIVAGGASSSSAGADEYGGFWIRTLAYSADFSIIVISLITLAVPLVFLGGAGMAVYSVLAGVGPFAYFVWFTASERQATFGKQLCGLKVEHAGTGQQISVLRSLGRELAKIVSAAVFLLGYVIIGFTGRKQGLHDFFAATVVVREGPARILLAIIVALAGVVIPIVAMVIFGAFFAGLMAILMGGVMGGMGDDAMKQMKPVPQVSQPAQPPRPKAPPPQASTPTPAPAAQPPASVPQPEAKTETVVIASAAPSAPAVPAKTAGPVPAPAKAAQSESKPKPAPAAADKREAVAATTPAASSSPALPADTVAMPAYRAAVAGPGYNDLMTAVLYRDSTTVAALLKLGKWADKPDGQGLTPLMASVNLGDARAAELLLKAGADPNLTAKGGMSAGSIARGRRDNAMLALLQRHGLR